MGGQSLKLLCIWHTVLNFPHTALAFTAFLTHRLCSGYIYF